MVLATWLLSGVAMADELPDSSLLQHYGVATDQLPTPAQATPVETKPAVSQFPIEAAKPLMTFQIRDKNRPEPTGNPSIDNVIERDLKACRRMRATALERGNSYITCDDNTPGGVNGAN